MPKLDCNKIAPKLYQGAYPVVPIAPLGFQVLVLCAKELQYRPDELGLLTLKCALQDDGSPMTQREWLHAVRMADAIAELISRGNRVLVTCAQGRNRSGLVNALVLYRMTSLSGQQCLYRVRLGRPGSLTNEYFCDALRRLPRHRREHRDAVNGSAEKPRRPAELLWFPAIDHTD